MNKNFTLKLNEIDSISELYEEVILNAPDDSNLLQCEPSQMTLSKIEGFAAAYEPTPLKSVSEDGNILN